LHDVTRSTGEQPETDATRLAGGVAVLAVLAWLIPLPATRPTLALVAAGVAAGTATRVAGITTEWTRRPGRWLADHRSLEFLVSVVGFTLLFHHVDIPTLQALQFLTGAVAGDTLVGLTEAGLVRWRAA
jgi:hypothetical protein